MEITWNRLHTCLGAINDYLTNHPDEKSRLKYALERTKSKIENANKKLQETLEDIITESYYADDKGVLVTDTNGRFQVTKDSLKERTRKQRELLNSKAADFDPYFATQVPNDLSEDYLSAFEGIVIKEEDAKRIRDLQDQELTNVDEPIDDEAR